MHNIFIFFGRLWKVFSYMTMSIPIQKYGKFPIQVHKKLWDCGYGRVVFASSYPQYVQKVSLSIRSRVVDMYYWDSSLTSPWDRGPGFTPAFLLVSCSTLEKYTTWAMRSGHDPSCLRCNHSLAEPPRHVVYICSNSHAKPSKLFFFPI